MFNRIYADVTDLIKIAPEHKPGQYYYYDVMAKPGRGRPALMPGYGRTLPPPPYRRAFPPGRLNRLKTCATIKPDQLVHRQPPD
jgi:hypothetical protein